MNRLIDFHQIYKERSLKNRRFKHHDVIRLIANAGFKYETVGNSFEGRAINKIIVGAGKRKVLLWSQMHGNEATATMALFDILNFFKATDTHFKEIRTSILSELELHIVPMLNPDGAERFQRRTSQEIDMNRDAEALQCPESRILKSLVLGLKPEFSFNLHDQSNYYAAGDKPLQTTIAFLATAYNKETEWNDTRKKAMQVICSMNDELQEIIPDRVGRFSDEFEPRAFGDNIQRWGSSLILVESGAYPEDIEKQYVRALNFHTILHGLHTIAQNDYHRHTLQQYEAIPKNNFNFFDLKIINLLTPSNYKIDMGILRTEKNNAKATKFTYESVIEDVGDLSVFNGIKIFDAKGGIVKPLGDFPGLVSEYKVRSIPKEVAIGDRATFVIDHGKTQTLVLNGEIF